MRRVALSIALLFIMGGAVLGQVNKPKTTPYTPKKLDGYTA